MKKEAEHDGNRSIYGWTHLKINFTTQNLPGTQTSVSSCTLSSWNFLYSAELNNSLTEKWDNPTHTHSLR